MKIELSHDILAQKVYERVSLEDKRLREVERLVRERYAFYQGEPKLTPEEVDFINPYLKKVDITAEEQDFVKRSQRRLATKRLRRVATWVGVVVLLLLTLAGTAFYQQTLQHNQELQVRNREIEQQKQDLEIAYAQLDRANAALAVEKDSAVVARNRAVYNARLAVEAADLAEMEAERADRAARVAEAARDTARQNARVADSLRRVALWQRAQADTLRRIAEQKARAVNLLTAQQMAEQSLKIKRDPRLKALLAREAYRLYTHFRIDSLGNVYAGARNTAIYQALYAALPDSLRSNRYTVRQAQEAGIQVRDLLAIDRSIFVLKGSGQTQRWTWEGAQMRLQSAGIQSVPDSAGIYYALAVVGEDDLALRLSDYRGLGSTPASRDNDALTAWFTQHRIHAISQVPEQGGLLLIGTETVYHWSGRAAELPTRLSALPHAGRWLDVQWQPKQDWLVGIDSVQHLYLWDVDQQVPRLSFTQRRYTCLTLMGGTDQFAVGRQDGVVELVEALGGTTQSKLLRGHEAAVTDLAYHPEQQSLASSSRDRSVQFWALTDDNYQRSGALRLDQNQGMVLALSFSPDYRALLTGDNQGYLQVWPLGMDLWYERLKNTYALTQLLDNAEAQAFIGKANDWASQGLFDALPEYRNVFKNP